MVKRFVYIDFTTGLIELPADAPKGQYQYPPYVLDSDYSALVAEHERTEADLAEVTEARQQEFAYILRVLKACGKATASDVRDELNDLRAWATNRATCFPVHPPGAPSRADEAALDAFGAGMEALDARNAESGMRDLLRVASEWIKEDANELEASHTPYDLTDETDREVLAAVEKRRAWLRAASEAKQRQDYVDQEDMCQ